MKNQQEAARIQQNNAADALLEVAEGKHKASLVNPGEDSSRSNAERVRKGVWPGGHGEDRTRLHE
jgi:hypothetical protein